MRHELSEAVPRQFGQVGLSGYLQHLRRTITRVAAGAWHRISSPKIGLAIVATLTGAAIVLAAKFVFGMHALLRLADVGGNVPGGPGALGAGGAGTAGGSCGPYQPYWDPNCPWPLPEPTPGSHPGARSPGEGGNSGESGPEVTGRDLGGEVAAHTATEALPEEFGPLGGVVVTVAGGIEQGIKGEQEIKDSGGFTGGSNPASAHELNQHECNDGSFGNCGN
jgi:hypothetical protein